MVELSTASAKMRITAPPQSVSKEVLEEIDSSIRAKVEKAFKKDKKTAVCIDGEGLSNEQVDGDIAKACSPDVIRPKETENPISVGEMWNLEVASQETEGQRLSSICFPRAQLCNSEYGSHDILSISGAGKIVLDTGAATSLVSISLVERLNLLEAIDPEKKAVFVNVNGERFHSRGKVDLSVNIFPSHESRKPIPFGRFAFNILERQDEKVILGMDWIYKHKVVIDTGKEQISVTSPLGWVDTLAVQFIYGNRPARTIDKSNAELREKSRDNEDGVRSNEDDLPPRAPRSTSRLKVKTDWKFKMACDAPNEAEMEFGDFEISGGISITF